uniref:Putative secreted protein n=1 Tax=Ixodes ricinus TaxID=34613 RepID=A0A6B0UEI6_IXORI
MRVFSIYSTFIATKVASFVYFLSDGWARTCHRTAKALCAHSCWWVAQSTTHLTQLRSVSDACEEVDDLPTCFHSMETRGGMSCVHISAACVVDVFLHII